MKYRKYNNADIICYESCAQIPGGKYIYESESGNICYTKIEIETITTIDCALYYPQNDGTMKCITAANEATSNCKSKGFNFVFGKECRNNCDNYYKLMDGPSTDPKKCFATLQEIKDSSENIKYYDPLLKQSWLNYPSSLYIKDEEEIDSTHSIFEVVEDCPKFYYEVIDDSNSPTIITYKYCVDDCNSKNLNLFFNQGNNKCKASCKDFSKKYYDPTNHECLGTCLGRPNLEYAFPINANNDPQPCLEKCPSTKYFISKKDANSVITNYECVDTCPFPNTGTSTHSKLDIKTKECRDACDSNIHIEANNICYPKCDVSNNYKYINTDTNECVLACPSELKKIVKLGTTGIYLCKSLCEDPLPYRFGDECVSQCPDGHNYIGYNNICKTKCAEDANGEHYYPTNADDSPAPQYIIYKCIDSCQEAIIDPGDATKNYLYYKKSEPNICLRSCTSGAPNYLTSNPNECLSGCPDELPFYNKAANNNYYVCQANTICTTDPYFIDGECVSDCTVRGKHYIDSRKICLDKCPEYEIKKKLTSTGNTYECRKNCGNEYIFKENEASEPECVTDCPQGMPYIGKDNVCKTSCSEEDGVYFYSKTEIAGPPSYKIFQCVDGCNPDHEYKYRAINNDKQCYKQCADTEVFLYLAEDENLCYDDCLKSEHNQFRLTQHDSGGSVTGKVCTTQCETTNDKFWGENKVCVDNCDKLGPNKLLDGNRCVDKCGEYNIQNKYQLDTTCVNDCSVDTQDPKRLRYSKTNYICKLKCGTEEYLIRETNECVTTCNDYIDLLLDTSTPPVLTGEKECVHSCESINKFYYPTRKMCLMKCNNNDKVVDELNMCVNNCAEIKNYIETNDNYYLSEGAGTYNDATSTSYDKCVKECPTAEPYIDNDKCEAQCPIGRKYFIQSDINPDKKCLIDCPTNYPYFTENTGANPCKAECTGYYVPNYDTNKIAKLCLPSCPSTSYTQYKFKLEYTNNTKEIRECYETCPDGFKYHYAAGNTDNNCYKECPPDAPYHKEGETICLKQAELTTGYLLYDIKELITGVTKCPDEYNLYTKITVVSDTINICLKECNFEYYNSARGYIKYEYLTPYKTCVDDCTSTSNDLVSGKHLIPDELEKECICENLYYISETTFEKICYDPSSITECKNTVAPNHNPYHLYGTKQCLKACNNDRILNPPEDTCYEKDTPCSSKILLAHQLMNIQH